MQWRFAFPAISNWEQLGIDSSSEVSLGVVLNHELLRAMTRQFCSEEFADFPIASMFPISLNVDRIDDLNLPTPLKNLFLREGVFLTYDFSSISLGQFLRFKNCGPTKVESLVAFLTEYTIRNANGASDPSGLKLEGYRGVSTVASIDAATDFYSRRVISGVQPLLDYLVYSGFQDMSTPATHRIEKLNFDSKIINGFLSEFLQSEVGQTLEAPPPAQLFEGFLREFVTSRLQQDIFTNRLSTLEPDTLEVVGVRNGVTREAVRQAEKKLVNNFQRTLVDNKRMYSLVRSVQSRLVAPQTHKSLMSLNFFDLSSEDYNFLLTLVGLKQIQVSDGNYCNDFSYFEEEVKASLMKSMGTLGIFKISDFKLDVTKKFPSISGDYLENWISQNNYAVYLNHGVEGNSIRSIALLVLYTQNVPMASAEIAEVIQPLKSKAYLENQLAADPNFIKPEKGKWGLRIWGSEEYTSISDLIGKYLDLHGSTRIDTLVQKLVHQFNVKESSVRAYAQSQGFQVVDGWVKRSNAQRERT